MKRLALLLVLAVLSLSGQGQRTNPPSGAQVDWGNPINRGLIAWWLFNEGGGARLTDIARGHDGVLTNMDSATDWVGSLHGGALDFDGSNDYVDMGTPAPLQLTTSPLTLSVWFQPKGDYTSNQYFLSCGEGVPQQKWSLVFGRIDNKFEYIHSTNFLLTSNFALSTDDWTHVVLVRSGGTNDWSLTFYINGVLDATSTTAINPIGGGDRAVQIGTRNGETGIAANCRISGASVFDRAFTAVEAQQLYHNPYGGILRIFERLTRWFVAPPVGGKRRVMVIMAN